MGRTIVCPKGDIFISMMTYHLQFLLLGLAGWVNRYQEAVIDYVREENRVLRAQLRDKAANDSGSLTMSAAGSPSRPRLWVEKRWPRLAP